MIKETKNEELISKILNNKKVFKWISDDATEYPCTPDMSGITRYLVDDTGSGVISIEPMNGVTCQVHIACLPSMWGQGHEMVKEAIKWGFKNTLYLKIVGIVPDMNSYVQTLLCDVGFEKEGVIKNSFLKDWVLHDQVIYGLSKYDVQGGLCQQR